MNVLVLQSFLAVSFLAVSTLEPNFLAVPFD